MEGMKNWDISPEEPKKPEGKLKKWAMATAIGLSTLAGTAKEADAVERPSKNTDAKQVEKKEEKESVQKKVEKINKRLNELRHGMPEEFKEKYDITAFHRLSDSKGQTEFYIKYKDEYYAISDSQAEEILTRYEVGTRAIQFYLDGIKDIDKEMTEYSKKQGIEDHIRKSRNEAFESDKERFNVQAEQAREKRNKEVEEKTETDLKIATKVKGDPLFK
ncbi:hypothetical protein KW782_01020 [Candidatus Parcubacteria bacterium]|nr:hypothetical protein [Candidatus Parcubacteria bacterium]